MRLAGSSDDDIAGAPTITQPTLVVTGETADFFEQAADAVAAALPNAERVVLKGQGHVADPRAVGDVLGPFLGA